VTLVYFGVFHEREMIDKMRESDRHSCNDFPALKVANPDPDFHELQLVRKVWIDRVATSRELKLNLSD